MFPSSTRRFGNCAGLPKEGAARRETWLFFLPEKESQIQLVDSPFCSAIVLVKNQHFPGFLVVF